ncbi:hypothetical protein V8J88_19925 [Massilia sp. W12]|uniref:hypothetical protein n=1 Tax=Massilia sp. W12 TaxID=3126507 RepID=UPI0030D4FE30
MTKHNTSEKPAFNSRHQLEALRKHLERGDSMIPLQGYFNFTKTPHTWVDGMLLRDFGLERTTRTWISARIEMTQLLEKFAACDPQVSGLDYPRHYPARILFGNAALAQSQDVFLYFPYGANIVSEDEQDVFGFELFETSERIFSTIHAPCIIQALDAESAALFHRQLFGCVPETLQLYAMLHEMSHRLGPWKVIPKADPRLKVGGWRLAVMGELAADLTLLHVANMFPELMLQIFLNRIFWYGRRGFSSDRKHALLNQDNDACGAAWLWQKFMQKGALRILHGRINLDLMLLRKTFDDCYHEVLELGQRLSSMQDGQKEAFDAWLQQTVPHEDGQLVLPASMRAVYERCAGAPDALPPRIIPTSGASQFSLAGNPC